MASLDRENVDTDQIIPAHWLKRITRTGYAAGLFEAWRKDPSFVLNDPRYAGATVLVAGPNFGSGSSREHAAWALQESGFRAVISAKLADIFATNALKVGLLPVQLPADDVARLMRAATSDPATEVTIDVEAGTVEASSAGVRAALALAPHARQRLLAGLDDIAVTLRHGDEIAAYEARRPAWLPRVGLR
ncbi:MAG TPA: 3-isopropylmalate dehydratase small subunit [Candidatus Limnocylindria bacterium]|nr:3-isopropylmalate dehydratase small subunit [Candidatus Limnocylindria bacterium]